MRVSFWITVLCLLASVTPGQAADFQSVDVRLRAVSRVATMRAFVRNNQYEFQNATSVDLISRAYGVSTYMVVGGPGWLDTDRFDITAKAAADAAPDDVRLMIRAFLAERFGLVVHSEEKPVFGYVLTAGNHPHLKASDGSGDGECEAQRGKSGVINASLLCHDITMTAFAEIMHSSPSGPLGSYINNAPVSDKTGLVGKWNFELNWTGRGVLGTEGSRGLSLFDALDKQLGVHLELKKIPLPVVVVDRVNRRPTDNSSAPTPNSPVEFDVADVRLSALSMPAPIRFPPGGRYSAPAVTLMELIRHAWRIDYYQGMLLGGPKWLDSKLFSVEAKAASDGPAGKLQDDDNFRQMLRAMLVDRFQLKTHTETHPVTVYALRGTSSQLTKADPTYRSACRYFVSPGGPASAWMGTHVCENTTMAEFVERLRDIGFGYVNHPVVDATGIEGAWDFSLSLAGAGAFVSPVARQNPNIDPQTPRDSPLAIDPNGAISLFAALEKQLKLKLILEKRPMPVLVIDHVEENPVN